MKSSALAFLLYPARSHRSLAAHSSRLLLVLLAWAAPSLLHAQATATTLTILSNGSPVTTVPANTMITLSAVVTAGGTPLKKGFVEFCEAAPDSPCSDVAILHTASLTTAGTATFKIRPHIGTHTFKALFLKASDNAASVSDPTTVTVTGSQNSTTTLTPTGNAGVYSLTATVTADNVQPPTGTVSFVDTSASNTVLKSVALTPQSPTITTITHTRPLTSPQYVVMGDLNNDGLGDLVLYYNDTISVYLGAGDGTFPQLKTSFTNLTNLAQVGIVDLNGDGNLDIFAVEQTSTPGTYGTTLLLGNGTGSFTESSGTITIPESIFPETFCLTDFDNDGSPDMVWAGATIRQGRLVAVMDFFHGNGDGTFATPVSADIPGTNANYLTGLNADLNHDGNQDLLVYVGNKLTTMLGNGDGTFTPLATTLTVNNLVYLSSADLNRDGNADIAVTDNNSYNLSVYFGNGDGTFRAGPPPVHTGDVTVQLGDFNGDHLADYVIFDISYASEPIKVSVLTGNGDGTFSTTPASVTAPYDELDGFGFADLDGDGAADIAFVDDQLTAHDRAPTAFGLFTAISQPVAIATAVADNLSFIGTGAHLVQAVYDGDDAYAGSTSSVVSLNATVAAPVLTPPPGNYTGPQYVSITTSTPGASIYYTTNGSTPTASSTPYTTPVFSGFSPTIIRAIAIAPGYYNSPVSGGRYAIEPELVVTMLSAFRTYGSPDPTLNYTVSGLDPSEPVTITPYTTATAISPVGEYLVSAHVTGANVQNYSITINNAAFHVNKAPLFITAKNLAVTYGQTPSASIAYFLTGFKNGETESVVSGAPVLTTSVTSTTPVGFYPIKVQAGTLNASNYYFVTTASGEGSVGVYKAPLVIRPVDATIHVGDALPAFSYAITGFVNGESQGTATTGAPALTTSATTTTKVGRYYIYGNKGTLAAQNYYFAAPTVLTDGILTILR